jgi:DNA polymerase III delta prime subunit
MGTLSESLNKLSHHAYLISGGQALRAELLSILEKKHAVLLHGNPDLFLRVYQSFTIDDARELKAEHNSRPSGSAGQKYFVLTMAGITVEAQNALLKLLEEPAEYAHFFLIVPSPHIILPTVKSRLAFIDSGTADAGEDAVVIAAAKDFLKQAPPKRLEFVKSLVEDISKDKKTKQDAIDFLNVLEQLLYDQKGVKKASLELETIAHARSYLTDRAPSVKMLLEYVAMVV